MKKQIFKELPLILLCFWGITSCRTSIPSTHVFNNYQTECLGVELDGSQTLRVWGKGKNKADAIEQAKKNAVRDVLFKGITSGSGECEQRPLLTEVNAQERYQYYFNVFFKDGGDYKNYISLSDKKSGSNIGADESSQSIYGVVVRVLRSELKQRLITDQIIKP